jgi:hypothetical protein
MLRVDCAKVIIGGDGSRSVGIGHTFNLSIHPHIHRYPIYSVIYARNHMTEWIGDGDGKSLAAIIG